MYSLRSMKPKLHYSPKLVLFILIIVINLFNSQVNAFFPETDPEQTCFGSKHVKIPPTMNDKYADLMAIVQARSIPANYAKIIVNEELSKVNPTLGETMGISLKWHSTKMERFNYHITKNEMYSENDKMIPGLLKDLSTKRYDYLEMRTGGTQFKLIMHHKYDFRALLKPMRQQRDEQMHPNHFYFNELEKHNAEIAAFHLDKVLGFRRAIPTVGRKMNIMEELYPLADDNFVQTFYTSAGGNKCFFGKCEKYCDTFHPICGNPNIIEVSLASYLPTEKNATRHAFRHPWRRSYDKRRSVPWQHNPDYCETIRNIPPYNSGRRLLDIMDMAILDFLIGNMDRHHYEMFKIFGADSFTIHMDHGRSFGRPYYDEITILAPLQQCCLIRSSTLKMLLKFHQGPKKLSTAMRESMANDPLTPVLWEPHLEALDRRVVIILESVRNCLQKDTKSNEIPKK